MSKTIKSVRIELKKTNPRVKKEKIKTKSDLRNNLDLTELEIESRKVEYGYFNKY